MSSNSLRTDTKSQTCYHSFSSFPRIRQRVHLKPTKELLKSYFLWGGHSSPGWLVSLTKNRILFLSVRTITTSHLKPSYIYWLNTINYARVLLQHPTCDLETLKQRQDVIAFFTRPQNESLMRNICTSLRYIKNVHVSYLFKHLLLQLCLTWKVFLWVLVTASIV